MLDLDQDWHVHGLDQDVQGTVVINPVPLLKLVIIIPVGEVTSYQQNWRTGAIFCRGSHSVTTQRTIMN